MASPNRRLALLAPAAVLVVIAALAIALLVRHTAGSDGTHRPSAGGPASSSARVSEAASLAPSSIPATTAQDWVSYADHVVLAQSTGGSLKVSVVYWSRQGAHLLPDLIPHAGPATAGSYLVPLVWLPDDGGRWAVLGGAVAVKRGALAPTSGTKDWLARWAGRSPQQVAHRLYATKPYAAALAVIGKDVHTRVKAVAAAK